MNDRTLLLRQIHPAFVHDGRVSSQAFKPTPKDERCLSVYDGDTIASADAWIHYTQVLGLASCGTMAVSVAECVGEGLSVRSDPDPFPEHAVIDFSSGMSENQVEKKAKKLKSKAEARGWMHRRE